MTNRRITTGPLKGLSYGEYFFWAFWFQNGKLITHGIHHPGYNPIMGTRVW